jgi:peptidyl-prolyl cis-trans isomerase B (cyclophilin B)
MAGDFHHVKPRGAFKIFSNYPLFAAIGIVGIGAGLLFAVILSNNTTILQNDDGGVRGEGVTRTTPEAGATADPETNAASNIKQYSAPPEMVIDATKTYRATIKTDKGDIEVELDAAAAPVTVNNFVFLARDGYYDGSTFFRVAADDTGALHFAQAGDPTGTGLGGPGYELPYESSGLSFSAGTIAMAKPQGPGTVNNGSQFYFTLASEPTLDGQNTAFGQVTSGLDVLQSFEPRDSKSDSEAVRIQGIEISES